MAYYLVPPNGAPPSIAPSLGRKKRGIGTIETASDSHEKNDQVAPYPYATDAETGNPTVVPKDVLDQFHFTFLIRHPRHSIPSYYRCTVPPLDEITGWTKFMPSEAGYDELRRVFDFLRSVRQIGPEVATHKTFSNSNDVSHKNPVPSGKTEITIVDADDLLDNPRGIVEAFCKSVGIAFDENMLCWDSEADHQLAREAFAKWKGWHEDAINSTDLKPRLHVSDLTTIMLLKFNKSTLSIFILKKLNIADSFNLKKSSPKTSEAEDSQWREKFGAEGARVIRETVDANVKDYEYLKQFALKVAT